MLIRIFKYWTDVPLFRQTPGDRGIWRGVQFKIDEPGDADYVVIHCHAGESQSVRVPPENIWLVLGEPPNESFDGWNRLPPWIARNYTPTENATPPRSISSRPALPWHVGRDYDFLTAFRPPIKTQALSWVTSARADTVGHRYRMSYLERIRSYDALQLFGRGFRPIADKFDGLAPFRYSIAFENYVNAWYWTEKVMDCFLTWTMPIYFGCTQLEAFFPKESFIRLDPEDADPVGTLKQIVAGDARERNLPAIAEARRRVLNDYNLFEFIVAEVEKAEREKTRPLKPRRRTIHDHTMTTRQRWARNVRQRTPASVIEVWNRVNRAIGRHSAGV